MFSSTSQSDPLQSKRFLAFMLGLFIAFVLGTKKFTHTFYIGIILILIGWGRYPHVIGWTLPWAMACAFGAMFFLSMGIAIGEGLRK